MGLKAYLDGILGEDKACKFLKKQGFEILKRNFYSLYLHLKKKILIKLNLKKEC